jgi:hypothetical protein
MTNKAYWLALAAIGLSLAASGCPQEPTLEELQERADDAQARFEEVESNIGAIDNSIRWLQEKRMEDPIKMDQLVAECQRSTGQSMEGAGGMAITECIKTAW